MEKERFLVEVTVRGEKGWKVIPNGATFGKVAKPIYWAKKGTSVVGAAADHANHGR